MADDMILSARGDAVAGKARELFGIQTADFDPEALTAEQCTAIMAAIRADPELAWLG